MNRKEKIQLLQAIQSGVKGLSDILPAPNKVFVWIHSEGYYSCAELNEEIIEDEFSESDIASRFKRYNLTNIIVHIIPPIEEEI